MILTWTLNGRNFSSFRFLHHLLKKVSAKFNFIVYIGMHENYYQSQRNIVFRKPFFIKWNNTIKVNKNKTQRNKKILREISIRIFILYLKYDSLCIIY